MQLCPRRCPALRQRKAPGSWLLRTGACEPKAPSTPALGAAHNPFDSFPDCSQFTDDALPIWQFTNPGIWHACLSDRQRHAAEASDEFVHPIPGNFTPRIHERALKLLRGCGQSRAGGGAAIFPSGNKRSITNYNWRLHCQLTFAKLDGPNGKEPGTNRYLSSFAQFNDELKAAAAIGRRKPRFWDERSPRKRPLR